MLRNSCVHSLLDTDFYKFTMLQAYLHQTPDMLSEWTLHCRNDEDLTPYLDQVHAALEAIGRLTLTDDEAVRLQQLFPDFKPDFIDYLRHFRYDPSLLKIGVQRGQLTLRAQGPLRQVSMLEIPVLATVSEIRNRIRYPEVTPQVVEQVTLARIDALRQMATPEELAGFRFADFGTRRRFSLAAQRQVLVLLQKHLPQQLSGTSNPMLAAELGLPVVGTMAHEWLQTFQAISPLADSQRAALRHWLDEYPVKARIALTDIIGIDAFCRDLDVELAEQYSGFRQDSGDPVAWGEKLLARLAALGIDGRDKVLVFSDGLDLPRSLALYRHFRGRAQCSFGIGTSLMGDFGLNRPMNIVMKMVTLNQRPVAKISDSPGKSLCRDVRFLNHLMDTFAVNDEVRRQVMHSLV